MSLDFSRISKNAKDELVGLGMKPDDVPFGDTGKGALELILSALAKAVVEEIQQYAEVTTDLQVARAQEWGGVPIAMDGGLALQTFANAVLAVPNSDTAKGGVK